MNSEELFSNKRELNNSVDLIKDLVQGDPEALRRFDGMNLDMEAIKKALSFITQNDSISDKDKSNLLSESWRINYRAKPPTPEEFITEKYLGPTAPTIYQRVKDIFVKFLDPTSPYRNLILYPHIGFGKSFLSTLITLYISVCVSLMRDPYKYFGLSPATLLSQLLISYSLKKSRELLLAPYFNIMEASPFFEKVPRRDAMKEKREEFNHREIVDKLYYTTADPDSELVFDSGITIKVTSSVQGLLGLSVITAVLSELAFFTDAGKSPEYVLRIYNDSKSRIDSRMKGNYYGKALSYDEKVLTDNGEKPVSSLILGDKVKTPLGYSTIDCIPFNEEDYIYEIELDDGKTIKCNLNHLWPCKTIKGKELLTTEEIMSRMLVEDIYFYEDNV